MCPMFVYKTTPNVFGISRSKVSPKLPSLKEEWCLLEGAHNQEAKFSGCEGDEALILEFMKTLDNEMFFQIMEFLEEEGYNVKYPSAEQSSPNED